ncbi:MAG: hypothetical protein V4634_03395 [Pseudomonadota bacterium]
MKLSLMANRAFLGIFTGILSLSAFSAAAQTTAPVLLPPLGFYYLKQLKADETAAGDMSRFDTTPAGLAQIEKYSGELNFVATMLSMTGDVDGAMRVFDLMESSGRGPDKLKADEAELVKHAVAEDAIAAIVREAKNRQIVILNEAHHVPMHRAFAMQLARELKKIGFEYLACETVRESSVPMLTGGYVHATDGYYSQDPVFAEFLRDSLQSGWKLKAYEHIPADGSLPVAERIAQRENGQATNLVDRIFRKDPKAKVFIYVGYSHAAKLPIRGSDGSESTWMAARLKQMTGIDPLTIDQTVMYAHALPSKEYAAYRPALERSSSSLPFVLKTDKTRYATFGREKGAFDISVIYPPQAAVNGRAAWLTSMAERQPRKIPEEWLPTTGRRLIYAYHQGDGPGAVPADLVLVEAGKPALMMMLPAGEYEFAAED